MNRTGLPVPKLLGGFLLLGLLASSTLACTTITSLFAGPAPAPTFTPEPSPTVQPPPQGSLSPDRRAGFFVILQSSSSDVLDKFYPIRDYLEGMGYPVDILSGPTSYGDTDLILFGELRCINAIDDLETILAGKLNLNQLARMRFEFSDLRFSSSNILIQINSIERFGPGL